MEYLTVKEAAARWGISERLVQKYCAQGRIEGAGKFGRSWRIPEDAEKPQDPRRSAGEGETGSCRTISFEGLMPLMNTPFRPGHCRDCIDRMEEGTRKEVALAEYYYFTGRPEEAVRQAELYLTCPDEANRLSACLIYAYASLSLGQIYHARYALAEIRDTVASHREKDPDYRAAEAFTAAASAILLHLPLPEGLPPAREYLMLLPPGLRIFALYVQAHYLYLQGDYERSLGIIETALAFRAEEYPIPAIYLHLAAVMDYMSLRQAEHAEKHLLAAWELAKPDDLIEGFGEHHGLLGGMLEAVIKPGWPDDFRRIISITYRFSAGWRKVHNPETGHDVADNLTTTEFAVAMLAARGWTNQEIAQHMKISHNTVKKHISAAIDKLGVARRRDLNKYMLR